MLTIKRIQASGEETLHEVKTVNFVPPIGEAVPFLSLEMPNGDLVRWYDGGRFFIMNDLGKTISKYNIDDDPEKAHA